MLKQVNALDGGKQREIDELKVKVTNATVQFKKENKKRLEQQIRKATELAESFEKITTRLRKVVTT